MVTYSYEKLVEILKTLNNEPSFSNIKAYIEGHKSQFTPEQYTELQDLIARREQYFNPPNCSQVRLIRAWYRAPDGSTFATTYSGQKAYDLCERAIEAGMKLSDFLNYMFDVKHNKDLIAWEIDTSVALRTAGITRSSITRPEGVSLGLARKAEQEKNVEVGVNTFDLISKLRSEIEELIKESEKKNEERIEELRNKINSLEEKIEGERAKTGQLKEITRILDYTQYQYFLKNAYKLRLPVSYEQIARGQYRIVISVSNEEEEKKALSLIEEAESQERKSEHAEREHLPGYKEILDMLCRNYERESGMPCGLSRTGALSTLADRLLEFAHSQGIDWMSLDLEYANLFAQKGKIYTREQADEAFNHIVSQITGSKMAKAMEEEIEGKCSMEAIANSVIVFDSISVFMHTHPGIDDPDLKKNLDGAIKDLKECGYYPNNLEGARQEANVVFEHDGTSYNEQLEAQLQFLERRYGK